MLVLIGFHGDVMTRLSALLALYEENLSATMDSPRKRAGNAEHDIFFVVSLNKLLNK